MSICRWRRVGGREAAGYPQHKGDFAWWEGYNGSGFVVVEFPFAAGHPERDYYVIPPIITADGKGGVFGWMMENGVEFIWNPAYQPRWIATLDNGARVLGTADTPEALIIACLDHLATTPALEEAR